MCASLDWDNFIYQVLTSHIDFASRIGLASIFFRGPQFKPREHSDLPVGSEEDGRGPPRTPLEKNHRQRPVLDRSPGRIRGLPREFTGITTLVSSRGNASWFLVFPCSSSYLIRSRPSLAAANENRSIRSRQRTVQRQVSYSRGTDKVSALSFYSEARSVKSIDISSFTL